MQPFQDTAARGDPDASPNPDEVRSVAKAAFEPTPSTCMPSPALALGWHVKDGHVKDAAQEVAEDVTQDVGLPDPQSLSLSVSRRALSRSIPRAHNTGWCVFNTPAN